MTEGVSYVAPPSMGHYPGQGVSSGRPWGWSYHYTLIRKVFGLHLNIVAVVVVVFGFFAHCMIGPMLAVPSIICDAIKRKES